MGVLSGKQEKIIAWFQLKMKRNCLSASKTDQTQIQPVTVEYNPQCSF